MGTFEAPNDYRSYLMHYGVKGMKWRNHRRSQMQKNFQLPHRDNTNRPGYESTISDRMHDADRHPFSRENTHRPGYASTISDRMRDIGSTRHVDGHRTAEQALEDARRNRRSRRQHQFRWEETHQATPGNMPSVIGHIPRTFHKPENINSAVNYLNNDNTISRKKKRK